MTGVPFTFATATTAIPLSELDVCFATQITIGSGQVGLGNTITALSGLSNVGTSNLVVGGGDVITTLKSGTFTPTDQSGAALSLTVLRAVYTQIGTRVWVELTVTYPVTGSGANSAIGLGALPNCANVSGVGGSWQVYFGGAVFLMGFMTLNTNVFSIYNALGQNSTNSTLSGATVRMQFTYSTV